MDHVKSFKDFFEYIPGYRKIVLLMFSFKNDVDLLQECRFLKNDIGSLNEEIESNSMEQNEVYLNYTKNEEKFNIEKIFNM